MIKPFRVVIAFAIAAAFAVTAFALSDEYVQFGKGPAQFLMTKEEVSQWKNVKTDDDAKAFIASFWSHREPAFKAEFDERVKYADEHFAEGRRRGSVTDRGRVLVVLGGPAKVERQRDQSDVSAPVIAQPTTTADLSDEQPHRRPAEHQVWTYQAAKTKNLGAPEVGLNVPAGRAPRWRTPARRGRIASRARS